MESNLFMVATKFHRIVRHDVTNIAERCGTESSALCSQIMQALYLHYPKTNKNIFHLRSMMCLAPPAIRTSSP